jgi:hypothetical protein
MKFVGQVGRGMREGLSDKHRHIPSILREFHVVAQRKHNNIRTEFKCRYCNAVEPQTNSGLLKSK